MTGTAKSIWTAVAFGVALGLLAVTAATKSAIPLFFMWAPLFALAWILARPGPGDQRTDTPAA